MLQINDVSKSYAPTLNLFKKSREKSYVMTEISFSIHKQDAVGLVGKSGCGKSTLARLLVRLEYPDAGSIHWHGRDITHFTSKELRLFRKDCQLILQDSVSSFNPRMTIKDSLLEPLKNFQRTSHLTGLQHIEALLPKFHLEKQLLTRYPYELSGGQRQRLNILRSLLVQPKILICDEITASLDKVTELSIIQLLKELQETTQLAILFISHDLRLVQQMSRTIHVMNNGKMIETAEKVNEQFQFQHAHTKKLFQSLPITHPKYR